MNLRRFSKEGVADTKSMQLVDKIWWAWFMSSMCVQMCVQINRLNYVCNQNFLMLLDLIKLAFHLSWTYLSNRGTNSSSKQRPKLWQSNRNLDKTNIHLPPIHSHRIKTFQAKLTQKKMRSQILCKMMIISVNDENSTHKQFFATNIKIDKWKMQQHTK